MKTHAGIPKAPICAAHAGRLSALTQLCARQGDGGTLSTLAFLGSDSPDSPAPHSYARRRKYFTLPAGVYSSEGVVDHPLLKANRAYSVMFFFCLGVDELTR